jgi:hypothetical protein
MMTISSTMGVAVAAGVTVVVAAGVDVIVVVAGVVPVITGDGVTVPLAAVGGLVPIGVGVDEPASEGRAMLIMTATKMVTAALPATAIQIKSLIRILEVIIRVSLKQQSWMKFCTYIYKSLQRVLHQFGVKARF